MTNATVETATQGNDAMLRALRTTIKAVPRDALPQMVAALAANCEIELLRTILEHRLIDPAQWVDDESMGVAIAPLACAGVAAAPSQAMGIVTAWRKAFGTHTESDLTSQLGQCSDPGVAAGLLALGADPLAHGPHLVDEVAPIQTALFNYRTDVLLVMLDDCLARDRLPVYYQNQRNALDWITDTNWHYGSDDMPAARQAVADHLVAQPLNPRWKAALGQALLGANKRLYRPLDDPRWEECTRRLLTVMPAVDLTAAQWGTLLLQGKTPLQFPGMMATQLDMAPLVVRAIATMHAAGADLDLPATPLPRRDATGTMLHAAVLADNAPVVAALLAAGADPRRTLVAPAKGKPRDAFGLATPGTTVAQYLAAWKAQQAMSGTLNAARAALHASATLKERP